MTADGRKLLVTGATGGIGRRLRARLEHDGGHHAVFLGGRSDGIDLEDVDALRAVVDTTRPDVVIHLAAMTGGACEAEPDRARAVNIAATAVLAEACDAAGVGRLVFASTAALYGDKGNAPVAEDGPLALTSTYAQTKKAAEDALAAASASSATLSTVALRIFNVFGETLENSLVTRLRRSSQEHPVGLNGLDAFVRDYVHVEDVVDSILLSIAASLPAPHAAINIGSGVPTSNRMLVEQIEAARPVWITVGEERQSYSCADISLAHDILGFDPRRTVTD